MRSQRIGRLRRWIVITLIIAVAVALFFAIRDLDLAALLIHGPPPGGH